MEKKSKKKRKRYTAEQRSKILVAGEKEGLTAKDVQKRFGVTPVTYYSWRKSSARGKPRRGRRKGVRTADVLESRLRARVQTRIQVLLPKVIETEVDRYVDRLLGRSRR